MVDIACMVVSEACNAAMSLFEICGASVSGYVMGTVVVGVCWPQVSAITVGRVCGLFVMCTTVNLNFWSETMFSRLAAG